MGPDGPPIPKSVVFQVYPYPLKRRHTETLLAENFSFITSSPDDPYASAQVKQFACVQMNGFVFTQTHAKHIHTHTYIYMYACMHACIRTHARTHMHTYTHTHTQHTLTHTPRHFSNGPQEDTSSSSEQQEEQLAASIAGTESSQPPSRVGRKTATQMRSPDIAEHSSHKRSSQRLAGGKKKSSFKSASPLPLEEQPRYVCTVHIICACMYMVVLHILLVLKGSLNLKCHLL